MICTTCREPVPQFSYILVAFWNTQRYYCDQDCVTLEAALEVAGLELADDES